MDWTTWIIVVGVLSAWWIFKRMGLVPIPQARQYLREGATVIDVRTPGEYARGHLPGVLNVPLGEISEQIGGVAPNPDAVLLLHCLSGTRSGLARSRLRSLGYTKVFNLGSYSRAAAIMEPRTGT